MKKNDNRFPIFAGVVFILCLVFLSPAMAQKITGKVIQVDDQTVTIALEGSLIPEKGDPATLFFEHEMLGEMNIGTWEITAVDFPHVTAVKKEATGTAKKGAKAVIDSKNPKPFIEKKETSTIARPDPIKSKADEDLIAAAEKGSLPDVKTALKKGANPNAARETGGFSLALAAHEGHLEIVTELLKAGANPNLEDKEGRTPLGMAAYKGHDDILQLLIEKGGVINYTPQKDAGRFPGVTALCMAAGENQLKTVQLLLSLGADPMIEDLTGRNALGAAVQSRNLDMINIFLNQGVPVTASASTGFSPLHVAAQWAADWSIMAYLIGAGADVNARIKKTDRLPPLFYGVTPLIISTGTLEDRQVLLLLLAGADPSIKSDQGNTALDEFNITKKRNLDKNPNPPEFLLKAMDRIETALSDPVKGKQQAEQFFREELVDAVKDNDVATLVALDGIGFDLNQALKNQGHLLAEAIAEGRFPMAKLLLKHGADPLARGEEGRTPFLASVYRGDIDLAKLFHEKGADPNDIPWNSEAGILQLIYEYGLGDRMVTIRYLIDIGADVNWRDEDENTPLHIAAKKADLPFFKLLIDNGANPRFKNEDGKSAFDLVPESEKPAFIKIQNAVWPPTSIIVKTIEYLESSLEKAKENNDWTQYREIAEKLIEQGDPKGFYAMGRMYHTGTGKSLDYKKALDYFTQGARIDIGDKDLFYMLGAYHEFGLGGLGKDDKKAAQWYEKARKKGSIEAGYRLGKMALDGRGMEKNPYTAFVHIQSSAAQGQGYPEAVHMLGYLYDAGIGIAQDPEMAKTLYEAAIERGFDKNKTIENTIDSNPADTAEKITQAYVTLKNGKDDASFSYIQTFAQKGNSTAQYYLGLVYFYGRGQRAVDYKTALDWLHKAARQGFITAQDYLGYMYENGLGTSKDLVKSLLWYLDAAKNGNTHAQHTLGIKYLEGRDGITKNYKTAMTYFRRAADKGHVSAQDYLGWMYETGKGVSVNYNEAVLCYIKAANQGNVASQNSMGRMYENGHGVGKSLSKAEEWYKKAADQGDETAKKNLVRLQSKRSIQNSGK